MSLYCIGDLQGCDKPFQQLLEKISFSPSRDTLYLLGDLVNRGPGSLNVLRTLSAMGNSAQCLLGNHDLHLLAMWKGARKPGRKDTSHELLQAVDGPALLDWLRNQRMAIRAHGWLMVHAGVLPQWTADQTMLLAAEVETALRGSGLKDFLHAMYGNLPAQWTDTLQSADRLRVIVNALTRLRFCTPEGLMEFQSSDNESQAPAGYLPWFRVKGRATEDVPMAFGHWSTLVNQTGHDGSLRNNTLPLDTGCVWGGCLTAARLIEKPGEFELIDVKCAQAQKPTA